MSRSGFSSYDAFWGTREAWWRADKDVDTSLFEWNVEVVPTEVLFRIRELDRTATPYGRSNIVKLAEILAREGFRRPVGISYYQYDRKIVLGEGNHRIVAALRLGFRGVPVKVWRKEMASSEGGPWDYPLAPAPDPMEEQDGHVPAELRPSDLGIPSRPLTPDERMNGVRP
jgi:hypothetical protein